jgi:HK97 family phage prohead protease
MTDPTMRKMMPLSIKVLGDRQVETTASTASLDREFDRILESAWRLENYRASGMPVLWAHDYKSPPIARSLDVRVVRGTLRTVDEFPPRGIYELADRVFDLVKSGFIVSKSVGFRPLTWRRNDDGGRDFTEVELLEHSYVSVPANPEAVVTAKSKGVRDPAALTRFFGMPHGGELIEVVDDGDARILVDERTLAEAMETYVAREVAREVRWQATLAYLPVNPVGDYVQLDTGERIAPRTLKAAMSAALGQVVQREVRAALSEIAGRLA